MGGEGISEQPPIQVFLSGKNDTTLSTESPLATYCLDPEAPSLAEVESGCRKGPGPVSANPIPGKIAQ